MENLCTEQFCCSLWREKWRWYFYSNFDLEGSKVAYLFCCLGSLNCKSHLCRNFIHENHSLLPLSFEAVNIFPCVHWCIIYSGFVLVYQNLFYIALFPHISFYKQVGAAAAYLQTGLFSTTLFFILLASSVLIITWLNLRLDS